MPSKSGNTFGWNKTQTQDELLLAYEKRQFVKSNIQPYLNAS